MLIHVVVKDEKREKSFMTHHPFLKDQVKVWLSQTSIFSVINKLIEQEDLACLVHDDVFLSPSFVSGLPSCIQALQESWSNWGAAGSTGIACMKVGYSASQIVRYAATPLSGGPNLTNVILPAQNIDGCVLLINCKALREREVKLPEFNGFMLYDLALSIETISAGLGLYIVPQLACWHDSRRGNSNYNDTAQSPKFVKYLQSRIKNRQLTTIHGNVSIPWSRQTATAQCHDIVMDSLSAGALLRPQRTVAIVVRTQFKRPSLLSRTLMSLQAFCASTPDSAKFDIYIVTDTPAIPTIPELQLEGVRVCQAHLDNVNDSRFYLIRYAVNTIEADWFWFIDDDDWAFPNDAERLALTLATIPKNSIVYFGSQSYSELPIAGAHTENAEELRLTEIRYYAPEFFINSLSGLNFIPLCGMLYPKEGFINIAEKAWEEVTYLEDYTCQLTCLMNSNLLPVVISGLYTGISIRKTGNTVTEKNKSKWNSSYAAMFYTLVNNSSNNYLFSYPVQEAVKDSYSLQQKIRAFLDTRSIIITWPIRLVISLIKKNRKLANFARKFIS